VIFSRIISLPFKPLFLFLSTSSTACKCLNFEIPKISRLAVFVEGC
ncbi:unnamed protein product, partial [Musa textilis]